VRLRYALKDTIIMLVPMLTLAAVIIGRCLLPRLIVPDMLNRQAAWRPSRAAIEERRGKSVVTTGSP
jgi:hypothetical protein